ncbi:hypothetical protein F2Q69_00046505 [Brassica cretica]|uniref:Uncharacterized protein n=1 Tax=Brassica cretica TaxID=69181 RepID=A0A8S9PYJ8_BRACR|nr:hypothetical protein F2Q69_00046505 [Brassica cretica]
MGVERCRGFDKRVSFFFLSFVSSSLLRERRIEWRIEWRFSSRWLASTKGDGSICGSRRGRETETFLSVALLEAMSGDLSLYRWLSETKNNGDCCGGGESKGGLIKAHDPRRLMKRVTDVDCVCVIRWFDEDASHGFFRQRTARSAYRSHCGSRVECCVVMQVTSGDSDGCCRVETVLCLVVSCCFVVVESAVL